MAVLNRPKYVYTWLLVAIDLHGIKLKFCHIIASSRGDQKFLQFSMMYK